MRQIAARRREARVTELRLDEIHRQPFPCQLRSMRVAERVGVNALFDPSPLREPWQKPANVRSLEGLPVQRAKDPVPAVQVFLGANV